MKDFLHHKTLSYKLIRFVDLRLTFFNPLSAKSLSEKSVFRALQPLQTTSVKNSLHSNFGELNCDHADSFL